MLSNRIKNQHLLWRAGFGPMVEKNSALDTMSQQELWKKLLTGSEKIPDKIDVAGNLIEGLLKVSKEKSDTNSNDNIASDNFTKEQRQFIRNQSREGIKNLNLLWLHQMINSSAQLREKVSLFWHGHFACRVINSYFQQELLHTIRVNALGNFGDLLRAVSTSPAMLQFLNNQQNRKQHPNENFAREVMELFTLGRGNYTEHDVKEAARAFTGWGYNLRGEFVFRQHQHDSGEKTILGNVGNFQGDDVLNILLSQKQTAHFITQKFYQFFVNEKIDNKKVELLSIKFYESNYNIKVLLTSIFTADWFFDELNIGNRIKSPVELIAGIRRILPMKMDKEDAQIVLQRVLGQLLFFPPNVAGWPGGKNWIDSSSLMVRLRIPQAFILNDKIDMQEKADDDINMGIERKGNYANLLGQVDINWQPVFALFEGVSKEQIAQTVCNVLLQSSAVDLQLIASFIKNETRENYIKYLILQLMCTPEYQLC